MKPQEFSILIVDDDPLMLELLRDLFLKYKFNIDTAPSGNTALQLLKIKNYNLVITDYRMPDGDGIELTKAIRKTHPSSPTILIISGYSDLLNEEIFNIGADGKFTKPFDAQAVRKAIQACLVHPTERWKDSIPEDKCSARVHHKAESLEQLEESGSVVFGRGGFFTSYKFNPPERNSLISFDIVIEKPYPFIWSGVGVVRWIQARPRNGLPAGLGVEIVSMAEQEAHKYLQLFGNQISLIPSSLKNPGAKNAV